MVLLSRYFSIVALLLCLSVFSLPASADKSKKEWKKNHQAEQQDRASTEKNRPKELSPEQRKKLQDKEKRFKKHSDDEKKRIHKAREKYKEMSPEEQKKLRDKYRKEREKKS